MPILRVRILVVAALALPAASQLAVARREATQTGESTHHRGVRALLPPDPPHVLRRAQDPRWLDGQLVKIVQDIEALQALERRRDVHWTYQYSSQDGGNRGAEPLIPVDDADEGEEGNDPVKGPCDPAQSPNLRSPDVTTRVGALRACMEVLTYELSAHPNLWRRVGNTCMLYTWSESQAKLDGLSDQDHGQNYKWAAVTEFQGRRELRAAVDAAKGAIRSLSRTQDAQGNAIDPGWENPADLPLVQDMMTAIAGSLVGVGFPGNFAWRQGGGNRQHPGHVDIRNRLQQAGHNLPIADLAGIRELAVALGSTSATKPDLGAAVWAPLYAGDSNDIVARRREATHWTLMLAAFEFIYPGYLYWVNYAFRHPDDDLPATVADDPSHTPTVASGAVTDEIEEAVENSRRVANGVDSGFDSTGGQGLYLSLDPWQSMGHGSKGLEISVPCATRVLDESDPEVWKNLLAANAVFITLTANSLQNYFGAQDDTDARVPLGVYLPHFVKYLRPNSGKNILVHPEAFERAIRGDIGGQGAHDKDGILLAFASPTSTRGLPFIVDKHAIRYDTPPPALDREEISDSFSVPDDADALRRSCDDFVSILQIDQDSPHLKFLDEANIYRPTTTPPSDRFFAKWKACADDGHRQQMCDAIPDAPVAKGVFSRRDVFVKDKEGGCFSAGGTKVRDRFSKLLTQCGRQIEPDDWTLSCQEWDEMKRQQG